ncbi:MAG: hypothetical protein D3908_12345 [Candidatus Electrothrix sp. AUS4]|nr:hypothetical protein [Candidatus Electrothrix sp. AUS4]
MQRQGTQIITEEKLQQLIFADKNISWLEKFELGGRSLLNRNSDRAFRFSHYTVQEFLLAWGVVHEQLAGQDSLRATDQMVQFVQLAGELREKIHHFNFTSFSWEKYIKTSAPIHPLFVPSTFFHYLDRNQSIQHNDRFIQELKEWLKTRNRQYTFYFLEVIQICILEEWCNEPDPKKRKRIEHYIEKSLPKYVEKKIMEFSCWREHRKSSQSI